MVHTVGKDCACSGLIESYHLLHNCCGQSNFVADDGSSADSCQLMIGVLHGIGFRDGPGSELFRNRMIRLSGIMRLEQKLGSLLLSILI